MLRHRFGHKSMSRYAWIAPVLVLLAFSVIYLFGNDDPDEVRSQEVTATYERVHIAAPERYDDLQHSGELSSERRQNVLQRLSAFRAEYRVVSPTVTVASLEASEGSSELAQRIGELLSQYNLGRYSADPVTGAGSSGGDSVIIVTRSADKSIAHALTSALSPTLSGTVRIHFDDTQRSGHLLVGIAATPRFTEQGVAVFPQR